MKTRRISYLAGFMAGLTLFFNATFGFAKDVKPKPGAPGTWVFIGNMHAPRAPGRDAIVLKGPFTDFRSIRFSVANAPLNLQAMAITFADGGSSTIDFRRNFPPGAQSRAVGLPGARRNIQRIDFWYQTTSSNQGRATLSVFGLK